jgi:hypothetical protein
MPRMDRAGEHWIVEEIVRVLQGAANRRSYLCWYKVLLDDLLWLWSVDACDRLQNVTRDAINKSLAPFAHASYSRQAEAARVAGQLDMIQREHVVPKAVLSKELFGLNTSSDSLEQDVAGLLRRFCFVVFVHECEHKLLKKMKLGSRMPPRWDSQPLMQRSPWARYTHPTTNLMAGIILHPDTPPP